MAKRALVLRGTISRRQFWPSGRAAPEVFRVKLDLPTRSRRRRTAPDRVAVDPLVGARVSRALERVVLHPQKGCLVRLRGVAAPVLHARPKPLRPPETLTARQRSRFAERDYEYRQPLAETAAFAFKRMLRGFGAQQVRCRVTVPAARPADAVDIAGRLLADVAVELDGQWTSLNQWLLWSGWALPDLTDRLSKAECRAAMQHAAHARKAKLGVWASYTGRLVRFDASRRFQRRAKVTAMVEDIGDLILPRLFRLQAGHMANRHAWITRSPLHEFLATQPTPCYVTASYLRRQRGRPPRRFLHDFIRPRGFFNKRPGELVFVEPRAQLITAEGRALSRW